MKDYTLDDFARMIDHTNLHADATREDMRKLCDEAKHYHFKMVAINQTQSKFCSDLLMGTDIDTGAAISFPLGQTTIESKLFDVKDAINNGANEIDYVINITELKAKNYHYIEDEMSQIVTICHNHNVPCKVIFENAYLTKEEIKKVAEIAKKVKPDFIKTSTGFGPSGAKVEDVKLMKSVVGNRVSVKAAGGIRDAGAFLSMIEAGADRIGTSAGVKIIEELRERIAKSDAQFISLQRN
ncbi:deoxyribose-phosphate aldolase [Lacticaseibacillus casei]|jgi:deoxyribose-phosphate aldolase|uniref:Deoxyribose-phosphate aldolase n=1 Tax=Lacticaseibacillus huelsenbergensis TaxID=3035291 RepID=A0ABY8DR73_9LACO|nr:MULTISPECIES: deoxyribose-phosphate aldolase [Lacticaseibacillus]MDG3060936.1 deoxyribose-phosphate aldolase [Lacticaseibacillus sp. BCRC 81376]QVI37283.1 deoxyribose-phosphate aldolase [Lacticaseibacillus casei]QXG59074.1 deoxyribose-phosphate aldolase [Lacticaseibacillus casei]WFB39476.1 deoxyribose-phosphate aldolase [Lacticaseibacillus huelsenbergensis]WFB41178.1 deoxyribose-phosphate aldolase [Lacticaseibacillus huelsenbergensis]